MSLKTCFKRSLSLLAGVFLCLSLFPVTKSSAAISIISGDVFAGVNGGSIQQWRNIGGTWTLQQTLNNGVGGFTTGMAFDSASNLYGTNFSNASLSQYTQADPTIKTTPFAITGGHTPESIVFNIAGDFYVGGPGSPVILKYSSAGGSPTSTFTVASDGGTGGTDWIDLNKDQKTMYYTSEGDAIKSFDVSTNTQNADFATGLPGSQAFAFRILGDGSVILADGTVVVHVNTSGVVDKTYASEATGGLFSLNLDPNGKDFWTGSDVTGIIQEIDIATGAVVATINTGVGGGNLFGVAVAGEITQGGGGGGGGTVPEPGTMLLMGIGAAGAAFMRRRANKAN